MKNLILILALAFSVNSFADTTTTLHEDIQIEISTDNTELNSEDKGTELHHYYFGHVRVGQARYITYTVTNVGNGLLTFQNSYVWGPEFRANHNCRGQLYPGQRCRFNISYSPMFDGTHYGAYEIHFAPNSVIRVNLQGFGTRY